MFVSEEFNVALEIANIQTPAAASPQLIDLLSSYIVTASATKGDADARHPTLSSVISVGRRTDENVTRVSSSDNDNTSYQGSENDNTSDQESNNDNTPSVRRSNNTVTLQ